MHLQILFAMRISPVEFECAVPEVRKEDKKVVYDIILKRAGVSWLAVSKRYSECRRFHSRLMTSEVVTQCQSVSFRNRTYTSFFFQDGVSRACFPRDKNAIYL